MAFPFAGLGVTIEAYLGADPTADPGTWPTPTDLSSRLLDAPMTFSRGRSQGQQSLASGSASFVLRNDAIGDGVGANAAGVLTPMVATSPYYPGWDLGAPVRISFTNVGASPPYVEFTGFIADVVAEIVPVAGGGFVSAVRVTLGGVWRRISQGAVSMSALQRFDLSGDPFAYWPLDDGPLSLAGLPTVGTAGPFTATAWADSSTTIPGSTEVAPWLGPGLELTGDDDAIVVEALLAGLLTPSRVTLDAAFLFNPGTGTAAQLLSIGVFDRHTDITTPGSQARAWAAQVDDQGNGEVECRLIAADVGSTPVNTGATVAFDYAIPHHLRLDLVQDGADIDAAMYLDGVLAVSDTLSSRTLTSFLLRYVRLFRHPGSSTGASVVFTDVALWVDTTPPSVTEGADATQGHVGELAYVRIERLCNQEGIPHAAASPDYDLTCGPQPVGDIVAVLRDTEIVGHGVLAETKDSWGLSYLPVALRHNLSAALTVDLATYRTSDDTRPSDVLKPARTDRRIRNEWTITRPGGSSSTDRDPAHQALRGRYPDSDEVNVEVDADTLDEASWRVHEGTFDGLRYGALSLDLAANAADATDDLLSGWLALDLGARVDRIGHPTGLHPPETVSLVLEGYSATVGHKSWAVNAVTEPYEPWVVGVYADTSEEPGPAEPKRYSPVESLVDASFDAGTDTALDVEDQSGGSDLWSTTADFPFDIRVAPAGHTAGGVRLRVTAISAPTGAVQTMTVDQAPVNGVERTIPAGWQVSLWQPAVYAQ